MCGTVSPNCRDKGMRGEEAGALCLSGVGRSGSCHDAMPARSHPHQDKHKAPASAPPRPLSLQNGDDTLSPITIFDCQISSEPGRAFHTIPRFGRYYFIGLNNRIYPPLYPTTLVSPGVDPMKLKYRARSVTMGRVGPVPPLVGRDWMTMEVSSGNAPCKLAGMKRKLLALTCNTLVAGIFTVNCERKRAGPRVTKKVTAALAGALLGLKSVMASLKVLPRCPSA